MRPRRLAKRRWFSRKYPIYIRLAASSQEQFLFKSNILNNKTNKFTSDQNIKNSIKINEKNLIEELVEDLDVSSSSFNESNMQKFNKKKGKQTQKNEIFRSFSDLNILSNFSFNKEEKNVTKLFKIKSSKNIFLFARSAREKERWFHMFLFFKCIFFINLILLGYAKPVVNLYLMILKEAKFV